MFAFAENRAADDLEDQKKSFQATIECNRIEFLFVRFGANIFSSEHDITKGDGKKKKNRASSSRVYYRTFERETKY